MEELVYEGSTDDEERLRGVLERAARYIVERVGKKGLEAIVLAGGFGRGEGTLHRDDGAPGLPFNDLDLLLVGTRRGIASGVLRHLKSSLAQLLGVDFLDIGYMCSSQFREARPTIFLYDLKYGSKILWGSPDVLEQVPSFASSDLPLTEATRLFLNRGIGLLYVLLSIERGETGSVSRKNAAVAWSKVVLAAGDAILLERKLYHWSYVERMKRIDEMSGSSVADGDFLQKHKSATLFKLTADFGVLPTQDPARLCVEARFLHEKYFRWVEQNRTFANLTDWTAYPSVLLRVGLRPLRGRLKDSLTELRSALGHVDRLGRFARLPLWGEERRLALLPLVLYAIQESVSPPRENGYLEAACMIEFGRRRVEAQDWNLLASALVGESHP
ncbi:MAG: hypothetical protein NTX17_03565 [Candidatus Eisenbacteria bacterium]|nr:hypothetical protein [Candidatus Eisenbacteria bacterium]